MSKPESVERKLGNEETDTSHSQIVIPKDNSLSLTNHLLVCLAEECAEVSQAVAKALRFGLDDDHQAANPDIVSPRLYIMKELADLDAVYGLLQDREVLPPIDGRQVQAKVKKLEQMMEYAASRGTLNPITQATGSASGLSENVPDESSLQHPLAIFDAGFSESSSSVKSETTVDEFRAMLAEADGEIGKLRQAIGWILDAADAAYNEDSENVRIHEIFNIAAQTTGITRRLPDEYQRFSE